MYAIVPMIRAGRPIRPGGLPAFRPFGFDRSAHNFVAIRLRDGRRRALIWYDDPVVDAQVSKIADDKAETLALASRTAFGSVVSDRAIAAGSKLDATIVNLLKTPPADWFNQPLRPGHDGYAIWLGPGGRRNNRFYFEPVAPTRHSKRWIDTFNRADGNLDGSTLSGGGTTWVETLTTWAIVSNQAACLNIPSGTKPLFMTNTDTDTDSMFAEVQLVTFQRTALELLNVAVFVCSNTAWTNGYQFSVRAEGVDSTRSVDAIFADVTLGEDAVSTTSGVLTIRRNGSDVEGFVNSVSVLGPYTDTGEASGAGNRHLGVAAESEDVTNSADIVVDNFDGGDYPPQQRFILH